MHTTHFETHIIGATFGSSASSSKIGVALDAGFVAITAESCLRSSDK